MLSRKEMVEIIVNRKESVILNGKIIDNVNDLPTEAELAKGDAKREQEARLSLEAQMDAIKKQLASLESSEENEEKEVKSSKSAEVELKSEAKDETKAKGETKEEKVEGKAKAESEPKSK